MGWVPKVLPFSTSNTSVRRFRHAVSLDEHRAKFHVNLYNWPNEHDRKLGTVSDDEEGEIIKPLMGHEHSISTSTNSTSNEDRKLGNLDKIHSEIEHTPDVEEVWFAVCLFSFPILSLLTP